MRVLFATILAAGLFAVGCDDSASKPATPASPPANANTQTPVAPPDVADPAATKMPGDATPTQPAGASSTAAAAVPTTAPEGFTPVAVEANVLKLASDNTTIQVIGTHMPPRAPDPRTIVFEKFTGNITFDPATKLPKSANAEIDATSLVAFAPDLTSHLKSRDFIEVDTFPTIKFASTRIEPTTEPGKVNIVGNLTLKDVTKEITIPAAVTNDGTNATVHGQVKLNRRDFNITSQGTMDEIEFTLAVGKKTEKPPGMRRGG